VCRALAARHCVAHDAIQGSTVYVAECLCRRFDDVAVDRSAKSFRGLKGSSPRKETLLAAGRCSKRGSGLEAMSSEVVAHAR
jgi:hypothetical protein